MLRVDRFVARLDPLVGLRESADGLRVYRSVRLGKAVSLKLQHDCILAGLEPATKGEKGRVSNHYGAIACEYTDGATDTKVTYYATKALLDAAWEKTR